MDVPENADEAYGIRYAEFTAPLVQATQELDERVQELEAMVERLAKALEVREAEYQKLLSETQGKDKEIQAKRPFESGASSLQP